MKKSLLVVAAAFVASAYGEDVESSVVAGEVLVAQAPVAPVAAGIMDILDGQCVASPLCVRVKHIRTAGEDVGFEEVAKEFAGLVAKTFPDAPSLVPYQDFIKNTLRDVLFLMRYADELHTLRRIGAVDQIVLAGLKPAFDGARQRVKAAGEVLSKLQVENVNSLVGLVNSLIQMLSQKFLVIAGDDVEAGMRAALDFEDAFESFLVQLPVEEQTAFSTFMQLLQEKITENTRLVSAIQGAYESSRASSTTVPALAIEFVRTDTTQELQDAPGDTEAVYVFGEKTMYTDLPVTVTSGSADASCICGEIVRDEQGSATGISVSGDVVVKKLAELSGDIRQIQKFFPENVKNFVLVVPA